MNPNVQNNSESRKPLRIKVLVVCGSAVDCRNLRTILGHTNWEVHSVGTAKAAKRLLEMHAIPVVLCSTELLDGNWHDIVQFSGSLPDPPKVVVFTPEATESFWRKAIETGAHDVLTTPFDSSDVYEVVSLAYRAWSRQTAAEVAAGS